MRANLLDPQENLNDPEVGLTYKTPAEPASLEKMKNARCHRHKLITGTYCLSCEDKKS